MEAIADEVTEAVAFPTIGIGASANCDGQVLVTEDMLGLFERTPRFVKRYDDLASEIGEAAAGIATRCGRALSRPTSRPTGRRLLDPLPFPPAALDGAPPASVHPGWGRKRRGASHRISYEDPLALPTDPAETFVREVDENLRRDQMRDMAKRYGKWIVAAVVLFLAAVGGYLYWQNQQAKQAVADSEAMSAALDKVGSGNAKGAAGRAGPAERIVERRDARDRAARPGGAGACGKTTARPRATFQAGRGRRGPAAAVSRPGDRARHDGRIRPMKPRRSDRPAEAAGRAGQSLVRQRRRDDRHGHAARATATGPASCSPRSPPTSRFPNPSAAARCRSPARWASTPPPPCRRSRRHSCP